MHDSSKGPDPGRDVSPGPTFRQVIELYRKHAVSLLILGAVILTPLALIETVTRDIGSVDTDNGWLILSNLVIVSLRTASSLFGEVFYSGAVALLVLHGHERTGVDLGHVFRKLPFGRLMVLDILYTLIVLAGLILLIVPGLVFMTWFWLSGAIIEVEDRGPIAALRRSRQLVKGSFRPVFVVMMPLLLVSGSLSALGAHLTMDLLGHSMFGQWMAESFWDVLLTPVYALGVIVVLMKLSSRRVP
ncbi:MAG: hypothetical protein M3Y45_04700 [Actinomycetota bacterium]|nr:hypothetical protein [Actinomycetota bacterium]